MAHSYRIPTNVVSSADLTLQLNTMEELELIENTFEQFSEQNPEILSINKEALVSSDFVGSNVSGIIDKRFLSVKDDVLKIMVWYDNEWGYSSRVADLLGYLKKIS